MLDYMYMVGMMTTTNIKDSIDNTTNLNPEEAPPKLSTINFTKSKSKSNNRKYPIVDGIGGWIRPLKKE